MLSNNFILYSGKIATELFISIAFFPLWWYSRGLFLYLKRIFIFLDNRQKSLALAVWIKNIFTPMYGQEDWQGRIISVFIRLIQIFFRSLIMLFWVIVSLSFVLFWVILPPFVLFQIFFQFFS